MKKVNGEDRPKVFLSYSWHPESDKQKVIRLAKRLANDGVYVVSDFWDLKEGHDKNVFMEKMVTDSSIDKVLLICNSDYEKRANDRNGGVGTEGTIVSAEVYGKTKQNKFIPIFLDKHEDGSPTLPVFLKQMLGIDFSNGNTTGESYDQLLRTIYDKPIQKRPPIGDIPSRLDDEPSYLSTAGMNETIKYAILNDQRNIEYLINEYEDKFLKTLIGYKLDYHNLEDSTFIRIMEDSINKMMPLKEDFIAFINTIIDTKYCTGKFLTDFCDNILQQYKDNDIDLTSGKDLQSVSCDNFRYFNLDLFLSLSTILVEKEKFNILSDLVKHTFFIESDIAPQIQVTRFMRFNEYNYTIEYYKKNRNNKNHSEIGRNIRENAKTIKFRKLIKTDILLYYLSLLYPQKNKEWNYWIPYTSIFNNQLEILPKLISKNYFEKIKVIFSVNTIEEYKQKISQIKQPQNLSYIFYIPEINNGLLTDKVGTVE